MTQSCEKIKVDYVSDQKVKSTKDKRSRRCTAMQTCFLRWSTDAVFMLTFSLGQNAQLPSLLPLPLPLSSIYLPYIQTPCLFISAFLSNKHTGWECRLESSAACIEWHEVQNLVMTRFSLTERDSCVSFCVPPHPFPLPLKQCSYLFSTYRHSSAPPGEWGWFSPCSHLHTHPNNSIILCLYLCFLPICCSFPTLFFLRLFISLCLYLSLSPPFIACAVKSDRPDKCGSVVSQIPEASERAKINHFSSSLSSALSLPLCLCSSPFLLQSSRSSVRSVLLVIIIFWLSFTVSFLFQYVAFD